ncbi:MAG: M20/M25/M40 family metallo-hydrolase [Alphaproteobacteria bacterium]|nr:M20/M25/M40 family metallo-hydrolase [Alphaproteobacteria bacterium]
MNRYKSHTVSIIGVKEILLLIFALLSAFPALKATANFEKNICFPGPEYLSRIGCDSSATDSIILKCINELNSDSIGRYIQDLQAMGTRFKLASNHRNVALWIKNKFQSMGYLNATLDSFYVMIPWPVNSGNFVPSWQYNVVTTLTGSINPEVITILGAHYDAVSTHDPFVFAPGADDNGSGVAGLFEIARVLKKRSIIPSSSIRFICFAGEEYGGFYYTLGSYKYAFRADSIKEKISLMINLDMIGYSPDSSAGKVTVMQQHESEFAGKMAKTITEKYTSLIPELTYQNTFETDSYSFWLNGFAAVSFSENTFNPNWHSDSDIYPNCNVSYVKEVVKAGCGMVITSAEYPSAVDFRINDPGTGNSLAISWKPNPEKNISQYKIGIGRKSNVFDTVYYTNDTLMIFRDLHEDSVYFFSIAAINDSGIEGPSVEKSDFPATIHPEHSVLIVTDSRGALLPTPDSVIYNYYDGLFQGFDHDHYNAWEHQKISLKELGNYKVVFWHITGTNTNPTLSKYRDVVEKYLNLGGKMIFSLFNPAEVLDADFLYDYPSVCAHDLFLYRYLKINTVYGISASMFNRAKPAVAGMPELTCDSGKVYPAFDYHLRGLVEAVFPSEACEILYRFGTNYDSTTTNGKLKNQPVGIGYYSNNYATVLLTFPLYYMEFEPARAFIQNTMRQKFEIFPDGIDQGQIDSTIRYFYNYPNPFTVSTRIFFSLRGKTAFKLDLLSNSGQHITTLASGFDRTGEYTMEINQFKLSPGVYLCRLKTDSHIKTIKLMVLK